MDPSPLELIESGEIDTVIVAFTDHYGRLMGKRFDAGFFPVVSNQIDIKSYDNRSNVSLPGQGGSVHVGGIEQIGVHPERTLFLCYPPEGSMALECLQSYVQGEYFIYIGEGLNGVNANTEFFEQIEQEWNIVAMDELDPFPQCFERMYIFKRR